MFKIYCLEFLTFTYYKNIKKYTKKPWAPKSMKIEYNSIRKEEKCKKAHEKNFDKICCPSVGTFLEFIKHLFIKREREKKILYIKEN